MSKQELLDYIEDEFTTREAKRNFRKEIKLVNEQTSLEDDDEIEEIEQVASLTEAPNSIAECKVYMDKFVVNSANTWPFAKKTIYIMPMSLQGIINAIQFAEKNNLRLRALGTKHSFSNVAQTDRCYIDTSLLNPYRAKTKKFEALNHNVDVQKLDQSAISLLNATLSSEAYDTDVKYQRNIDKANLIDIPSSLRVWMLNYILCPTNNGDVLRFGKKRIFNMGGADVQHFAGAFSTGTHGSGGVFSTYHDMIRSLVLVGSEGKVYRIEPTKGITNKQKHDDFYKNKTLKITLIQDDDFFNASIVSMGCFGIVYSVIIEVTDMKELYQECVYSPTKKPDASKRNTWNDAFVNKLVSTALAKNDDFYAVQVNPYKLKNTRFHSVLEKKTYAPTSVKKGKKVTNRQFWPSFLGKLNLSVALTQFLANKDNVPPVSLIESSLKAQSDHGDNKGEGFYDVSYKVLNAGTGKLKAVGVGIEFAFPIEKIPAVMQQIFDFLEHQAANSNGYYLNAPIALRFVHNSNAYLAPNYHMHDGKKVEKWCYIEILRVTPNNDAQKRKQLELFKHLQLMLLFQGGRPHWGLNFEFPFSENVIDTLYPKFDNWLKAFLKFNSNGVFDNEFVDSAHLRSAAERKFVDEDLIV